MAFSALGRSVSMLRMAWPRMAASRRWICQEVESKFPSNQVIQKFQSQTNLAEVNVNNGLKHVKMVDLPSALWLNPSLGSELVEVVELPAGNAPEAMEAVNTRRQLRRWKYRRKRDGGKDRKFRLKYG
eukprot:Skav228590  [mRNA]  locus=scaffold6121:7279:7662:- [translate_table: standard]